MQRFRFLIRVCCFCVAACAGAAHYADAQISTRSRIPELRKEIYVLGTTIRVNAPDGFTAEAQNRISAAFENRAPHITVYLENVASTDNAQAIELEIRDYLVNLDLANDRWTIRLCQAVCDQIAPQTSPPGSDVIRASRFDGPPALVKVDSRDGPMQSTLRQIENAVATHAAHVHVQLEYTSKADDPEVVDLVAMEIRDLMDRYGYVGSRWSILHCEDTCEAKLNPPAPVPPTPLTPVFTLKVSALDGPMSPHLRELDAAKSQGAGSFLVHIEHTALQPEPELIELVELEVIELIQSRFGYTRDRVTFLHCPAACSD